MVARCADAGDSLAVEVLTRAGEQLAELVESVFRKMSAAPAATPAEPDAIGVAFTGSVLTRINQVRATMTARLAVLLPAASVRQSSVDPLEGALLTNANGNGHLIFRGSTPTIQKVKLYRTINCATYSLKRIRRAIVSTPRNYFAATTFTGVVSPEPRRTAPVCVRR